ncbi:HAD-superfamily phosphatase [Schizophyllum commune H4-8]|uniref:HAD superfamily phosphatase n=1 Tax=Schizophyllum commune (strain H4-8 / FGSC 9210) TaxID=578458 RepID=D8QA37_SCHCM|nr:HAD-superfamily phosphatase [Schizophyllum commune H4-8]KAI5890160.1 HAD-superfamily phosphatase [Schizophyllum commune H4-8]
MPLNIPGLLVPFHLLVNPRLVLPSMVVRDIRQLDFHALRRAGYRGAVFDKDNCLTIPHKDHLVPELEDAWAECRAAFGPDHVVVVSNSAGTRQLDAGAIQAEAVGHALGVPVLCHAALKPSYSCIKDIRAYFAALPKPVRDDELVVVGDRVLTDVVMARRMKGPLAVWTTGVWQREATVMRLMERGLVDVVRRWTSPLDDQATRSFIRQSTSDLEK